MRSLVFTLLLVAVGCSGPATRDPIAPNPGVHTGRSIVVKVDTSYKPTDAAGPVTPNRYSPSVNAKTISGETRRLLVERGTSAAQDAPESKLEVDITQATVKYDGQRGVFPLKVFFTIFFFPFDVPNYFIASDRFSLTLNAKWRLVENGQFVAEGATEGKQGGTFGDLSRGWYFVGYLRMPSPLKADEWQEIADTLAPGAQDALAESVVLDLEQALAAKKTGEIRATGASTAVQNGPSKSVPPR